MLLSILPKNKQNICYNLTYLIGKKNFVRFLGELRKNNFAFEIYWPLEVWKEEGFINFVDQT